MKSLSKQSWATIIVLSMLFVIALLSSCAASKQPSLSRTTVNYSPSGISAYRLCEVRGHVEGRPFSNGETGYDCVVTDYPDSTVQNWKRRGVRGYYCLRCEKAIYEEGADFSITIWKK